MSMVAQLAVFVLRNNKNMFISFKVMIINLFRINNRYFTINYLLT